MPNSRVTVTPTFAPVAIPAVAGDVQLDYTVSGSTAVLSDITAVKSDELNASHNPNAVVDLSGESVGALVIPPAVADKLSEELSDGITQSGTLTIKLPVVELVLDELAVKAIAQADDGLSSTLTAELVGQDELKEAQKEALARQTTYGVLRLGLATTAKEITSFGGGRMTVRIPFAVPAGYRGRNFSVFFVTEGGGLSRHATGYADGMLSFRIAHFSDFVVLNDPIVSFDDVSDDAWYTDVVDYVARSGIMVGSAGQFTPEAGLTRAMFAQILYNMESGATANSLDHFADVSPDAWYVEAVNWAVEAGVVSGVGNDRFAPETAITREQLAVMLYNYARYKDYDTSRSVGLSRFSDYDHVASWAEQAMSWAAGEKLFSGVSAANGYALIPNGGATRAQTAKVLTYFCESYER